MFFFPVGADINAIVAEWIDYLRQQKLWGNDDPIFPATDVAIGPDRRFGTVGLAREHWKTTGPVRDIFRNAFTGAGLPYFNPHSFRNTLVQLAETLCQTPEQLKAWSQNLGHEKVLTTLYSYRAVSRSRQAEIIGNFRQGRGSSNESVSEERLLEIARQLRPLFDRP